MKCFVHTKQIILPSTIFWLTWLFIDGFMEENGLAPSSKKEIRFPQYRRYPQNLKSSQSLATRHKKDWALLSPLYKKYFRVGGVYTIENKGTNTGYQKVIGSRNQKWEIVEITTCIIFFAWDLYSLFFIQRVFKSHLKKITPI